jgi:hypothetical protein
VVGGWLGGSGGGGCLSGYGLRMQAQAAKSVGRQASMGNHVCIVVKVYVGVACPFALCAYPLEGHRTGYKAGRT